VVALLGSEPQVVGDQGAQGIAHNKPEQARQAEEPAGYLLGVPPDTQSRRGRPISAGDRSRPRQWGRGQYWRCEVCAGGLPNLGVTGPGTGHPAGAILLKGPDGIDRGIPHSEARDVTVRSAGRALRGQEIGPEGRFRLLRLSPGRRREIAKGVRGQIEHLLPSGRPTGSGSDITLTASVPGQARRGGSRFRFGISDGQRGQPVGRRGVVHWACLSFASSSRRIF
jgi:hypothetical protein